MACSPDGSQSVWKRTLSAASAVATHAMLAAKTPSPRIADFMLSPGAPQASGDRNCSRRHGPFESKIAAPATPLCLHVERHDQQGGDTSGSTRRTVPAYALLP